MVECVTCGQQVTGLPAVEFIDNCWYIHIGPYKWNAARSQAVLLRHLSRRFNLTCSYTSMSVMQGLYNSDWDIADRKIRAKLSRIVVALNSDLMEYGFRISSVRGKGYVLMLNLSSRRQKYANG